MLDNNKTAQPALLQVKSISKKFGEFYANDSIDLSIEKGKVHALLGENGAGKSTLVKMMYGALQPTFGSIFWQGKEVSIYSPAHARELGIGMVFQHFSLFEALSVSENISLALPPLLRQGDLSQRISDLSLDYGLPLNPAALVADLSVGERQRIEIVRCLLQEPKLLIMDEPTAVLTPQEAQALFATLHRLVKEGCAVLYISHRLEEVKRICQDATILRHGKLIAKVDPQIETAATLAKLMVGTSVHEVNRVASNGTGDVLLSIKQMYHASSLPFGINLVDISLQVRSGEILAVAGVAGNGQGELFSVISGEEPNVQNGSISLLGQVSDGLNINQRRCLGTAFIPEERIGHGAVEHLSLTDNILLSRHACTDTPSSLNRRWLGIDREQLGRLNKVIGLDYDVRKSQEDVTAASLSGGNLQKFVVGREMNRNPKVLIINQPTWGVDAGAAALIRQALIDLSRQGSAILIISQDLDEIFELADSIAVMSRGQLSTTYPAGELSREEIGLMMAGSHEKTTQEAVA